MEIRRCNEESRLYEIVRAPKLVVVNHETKLACCLVKVIV